MNSCTISVFSDPYNRVPFLRKPIVLRLQWTVTRMDQARVYFEIFVPVYFRPFLSRRTTCEFKGSSKLARQVLYYFYDTLSLAVPPAPHKTTLTFVDWRIIGPNAAHKCNGLPELMVVLINLLQWTWLNNLTYVETLW